MTLAMAETLADGLAEHGYATTALGSGRAALEALPTVDLIITDLRMPDIDGLALLDAGRAADVPVIVMTAFGAIDSARGAALPTWRCATTSTTARGRSSRASTRVRCCTSPTPLRPRRVR
jgi:CheY-like chemotaxis protein